VKRRDSPVEGGDDVRPEVCRWLVVELLGGQHPSVVDGRLETVEKRLRRLELRRPLAGRG
jgi:hypothetical protein